MDYCILRCWKPLAGKNLSIKRRPAPTFGEASRENSFLVCGEIDSLFAPFTPRNDRLGASTNHPCIHYHLIDLLFRPYYLLSLPDKIILNYYRTLSDQIPRPIQPTQPELLHSPTSGHI